MYVHLLRFDLLTPSVLGSSVSYVWCLHTDPETVRYNIISPVIASTNLGQSSTTMALSGSAFRPAFACSARACRYIDPCCLGWQPGLASDHTTASCNLEEENSRDLTRPHLQQITSHVTITT